MALVQPSYGIAAAAAPAAAPGVRVANAAPAAAPPVSRLVQMQARFQKKQMEEKEQKLLRLYESQQQRAFQRVGRHSGSAGSSSASLSSSTSTLASVGAGAAAGKVRQLFEERRTNGWDRSYPLEPVAGGKARSGTNSSLQPSGTYVQPLPLAVPKTKAARGASLDRSYGHGLSKTNARRSKSHARAGALNDSAVDAGDNALQSRAVNKLYCDGGGHSFRKVANNNNNRVDDFNNRNYRRHRPAGAVLDADNYDDEDFEDEVNYETLGEEIRPAKNGNLNTTRQEELFSKYQVRELGNHDLLATSSPPTDGYDDIDQSTFIYEKQPSRDEGSTVNGNDRFKTYVSNKHGARGGLYKEEMASRTVAARTQDAKKIPVTREVVSPPGRAPKSIAKKPEKPAGVQPETKSPIGSKTSTEPVTSKHNSNVASRPTSSSIKNYSSSTKPLSGASRVKNGPGSQVLRPAPSRDDLTECPICHRRFTNDRIKVHESICSKTAQKKRKEYDALKHRVQGTEAEQFVKRALKGGPSTKKVESNKKGGDWRKKHEEFIQTIRAAKVAQAHVAAGGKLTDLPPPPPLDTSDYIQCPHCGRRFNEAAAERHIPRCANMQHNKPKSAANKTIGGVASRRR